MHNGYIYNKTNAVQRLYDFQSNWNTNHTLIKRDVAILYSGIYSSTLGVAFVNSLCYKDGSYATVCDYSKMMLTCAHELGHVFGSEHDQDYGSLGGSCVGSNAPIMCASAVASGSNFNFSPYTRNIILTSANAHASCLSDYWSGSPVSTTLKTWSNWQNQRWIGSWLLQDGDKKTVGNFDGLDNDEEVFFASNDNKWVGVMDFSCDQGTDWYHLWANSGKGSFGTWVRNNGDRFMAGDFDGNGKSDLLAISGNANWAALQEYKPSIWSWTHKWGNTGSRWIAGWGIGPQDAYAIGDFNGDGSDDLLCTNPNGWAMLIKFNWVSTSGGGGYYNPQTIWSNNGNGWVGGVQINNTQRWLKGKFATTAKDELLTISNTWVTTQRFDGTSWQWIWSQYGASHFASMYVLPLNNKQHPMAGNIDADNKDEFVLINERYVATADYDGTTYNQNWNNGGTYRLNDWDLNINGEYMLVKAAPTAPKQVLSIRSEKRSSGWWLWKKDWWEPNLCAMYRTNAVFSNFKVAPEQSKIANTNNSIKIYPNPTNDIVTVEFGADIESSKVTITDILGRQVAQQTLTQTNKSISLQELPSGTYVIKAFFSDHSTFTSKITVYEK